MQNKSTIRGRIAAAIDNIPGRYLAGACVSLFLCSIGADMAATIHSAGVRKAIIWYADAALFVLVAAGLGMAAVAVRDKVKGSNGTNLG